MDLFKKKKIKTMNSKVTTNSQPSTTELKKKTQKEKLSKQVEQEQSHRNGDHMWRVISGEERGLGEKVQGIRSIIGRYKIDRGRG